MFSNSVVRSVILPAAGGLALLVLLVGAVLTASTSRSDTIATRRQQHLVTVAIAQGLQSVANDQEASTLWDDAVIKLRAPSLDATWVDNNLGIWFNTYYHHDETYLIDPRNRPVYAMQAGRRVAPDAFAHIAKSTGPLIRRLRSRLETGWETAEGATGRTKGEEDILLVDGHPAIVSIKPVVPETPAVQQQASSEFLHVSLRYLDGSFLSELADKYKIDDARFSRSREGSGYYELSNRAGQRIGYVTWEPFRPGTQIAAQMIPVLAGALLLIAITLITLLMKQRANQGRLIESKKAIEHLAYHDALTGLPNRAYFRHHLERALAERTGKDALAVVLLDLDRFKIINDTYGHPAGDAVVCMFADRLVELVEPGDTVARLGGDEFAIIVEEGAGVDLLCGRILAAVARPIDHDGHQLRVGVSIGVAHAGQEDSEHAELLRKADIALYRAKADGRNCYRRFDQQMDRTIKKRGVVEQGLRLALHGGIGLDLHFQPIVDAHSCRLLGLEALIRWYDGERMWTPDEFIPIAEETGLILPLGEWAMARACEAARKSPAGFISVNLSPLQCRSQDFAARAIGIAAGAGTDPARIQFEITERALFEGDSNALATLATFRKAGFGLVLEDFGTGYSSLTHLRGLGLDKVKLDRTLLSALESDAGSAALVAALCEVARALDLAVAAEGVESGTQRDLLRAAGCGEMQGHLFAPALPFDEAVAATLSPSIAVA